MAATLVAWSGAETMEPVSLISVSDRKDHALVQATRNSSEGRMSWDWKWNGFTLVVEQPWRRKEMQEPSMMIAERQLGRTEERQPCLLASLFHGSGCGRVHPRPNRQSQARAIHDQTTQIQKVATCNPMQKMKRLRYYYPPPNH
ncbi:hypothetical protein PIB30_001446 [Stylosanthes scabra]|uniref:Uncharacterized protein n=1 Tax=Stylosanthes scabra TaxID=79078 RepID=A0ABU6Q3N4_9FABA|nr:hypothetical protein [Stylosanthes scabra]